MIADQLSDTAKLSRLLTPLPPAEFFRSYWEQSFLHLRRDVAGYYDNLLSLHDLDQWFANHSQHPGLVNVVRGGRGYALEQWTRLDQRQNPDPHRVVALAQLFARLNQGATLVLDGAEMSFPGLAGWCSALGRELGCYVQANLYLTPPGEQGFTPHYDAHNAFILQIYGRKQWRLYDFAEASPVDSAAFPDGYYERKTPSHEIELAAGDALYLPRGLVHCASAGDAPSLHITVGLMSGYGFHLLEELARVAQDEPFFRRALPLAGSSAEDQAVFAEEFAARVQELLRRCDANALRRRYQAAALASQLPDYRRRFTDWLRAGELSLDSLVRRRPGVVYTVRQQAGQIILAAGPEEITLPLFLAPALALLETEQPFAARALSGLLTDAGKLELATKLLRAGVLTIVGQYPEP